MLRGKYLRERKAIRNRRRIKFLIIVSIILMIYRTLFDSYSLFESEASSKASIDVAFFLLNDGRQSTSVALEDMEPGTIQFFTFSISNYLDTNDPISYHVLGYTDEEIEEYATTDPDGYIISETDMEYDLKIRTTTNLPLTYELYRNQSLETDNLVNVLDLTYSDSAYLDPDETYFKKLVLEDGTDIQKLNGISDSGTFYLDVPTINTYTLKVELPGDCDTVDYQDIIECIEVTIDARQLITE